MNVEQLRTLVALLPSDAQNITTRDLPLSLYYTSALPPVEGAWSILKVSAGLKRYRLALPSPRWTVEYRAESPVSFKWELMSSGGGHVGWYPDQESARRAALEIDPEAKVVGVLS